MGVHLQKVRKVIKTEYQEVWDKYPDLKKELKQMWTEEDRRKYSEGFLEGADGLDRAADEIGISGKNGKYAKFWDKVPADFRYKDLPAAAHKAWGTDDGIEASLELSRAAAEADIPRLYKLAMEANWDELNRMIPADVIRSATGKSRIENAKDAYKAIAAWKKLGEVYKKEWGKVV